MTWHLVQNGPGLSMCVAASPHSQQCSHSQPGAHQRHCAAQDQLRRHRAIVPRVMGRLHVVSRKPDVARRQLNLTLHVTPLAIVEGAGAQQQVTWLRDDALADELAWLCWMQRDDNIACTRVASSGTTDHRSGNDHVLRIHL